MKKLIALVIMAGLAAEGLVWAGGVSPPPKLGSGSTKTQSSKSSKASPSAKKPVQPKR